MMLRIAKQEFLITAEQLLTADSEDANQTALWQPDQKIICLI